MSLTKRCFRRFLTLLMAVILGLGLSSAASAGIDLSGVPRAGEPVELRITPPSVGAGAASLTVSKVGALSPWLYASYLPEGEILSMPVRSANGSERLTLTFWDAGRYRAALNTGESREFSVGLPGAKIAASAALFAAVAFLGFWCGWAGGGLKRPTAGLLAASLILLAAGVATAHGGANPAEIIRLSGGQPLVPGKLLHLAVPVEAQGSGPLGQREARVTLEHEEDGLRLLEANVRFFGETLELGYAFPEGTDYHLTVNQKDYLIPVEPVPPQPLTQARAYSVLVAVYLACFLAGWWVKKRRFGQFSRSREA